jgi:hypothetical protein
MYYVYSLFHIKV